MTKTQPFYWKNHIANEFEKITEHWKSNKYAVIWKNWNSWHVVAVYTDFDVESTVLVLKCV